MTYDPRTVLERYRLATMLSPEAEQPTCSLMADGLPPANLAACEILGCDANCYGLSTVAKTAIVDLVVADLNEQKRNQT